MAKGRRFSSSKAHVTRIFPATMGAAASVSAEIQESVCENGRCGRAVKALGVAAQRSAP
jgi:hypothetical protein